MGKVKFPINSGKALWISPYRLENMMELEYPSWHILKNAFCYNEELKMASQAGTRFSPTGVSSAGSIPDELERAGSFRPLI